MNVINMSNISVNFGDRTLLDNISLGINKGDKIGIIGANGHGKSTLLKIISGDFYDYSGEITKMRGITVSSLSQHPHFDKNETILEYVGKGGNVGDIWDKEVTAKNILIKLGINNFTQNISELSGGQRKRVALARTVLEEPDVLIMDEPTNHLDNFMIDWLEEYLKAYKGILIMVTHDRYFLDEVTNKIVEIEDSKLYEYNSNYQGYLELKCQRVDMNLASQRKRESILRNELKWVMRGARARSTKQKSRLQRFEDMSNISKIKEQQSVIMESGVSRMGKKTIEVKHISKRYDSKVVIKDFSYIFLKNERIGIVGVNGCGKTTLLNIICGVVKPDSGDVDIGDTINIGYFSQHNEALDENLRVIDYIKNIAEFLPTNSGKISASQMLERFLFNPDMQYSIIGKLSGGEKRRLYLLKVLMQAPNVLILDEPTNDLDIMTLNVLEDFLDNFEGIVITVSHDRYFLDRTVNRILSIEGNGIINEYMGGYSDYYNKVKESNDLNVTDNINKTENDKKSIEKPKSSKLKFSYNEQREYDIIDSEIENLENDIEQINKNIEKSASDFIKLNELMCLKTEKEKILEEKMERWVYLNDLAEQINEQRKD